MTAIARPPFPEFVPLELDPPPHSGVAELVARLKRAVAGHRQTACRFVSQIGRAHV